MNRKHTGILSFLHSNKNSIKPEKIKITERNKFIELDCFSHMNSQEPLVSYEFQKTSTQMGLCTRLGCLNECFVKNIRWMRISNINLTNMEKLFNYSTVCLSEKKTILSFYSIDVENEVIVESNILEDNRFCKSESPCYLNSERIIELIPYDRKEALLIEQ